MSKMKAHYRCPSWIRLGALLLACAIALAAAEAMTVFRAVATQMEPTVLKGEAVLIDTETYRSRGPSRGDVVMLIGPRDKNEHLFRIVGLPGERIQMRDGQLLINGGQVPRRRIEDYAYHFEASLPAETMAQYIETLPPGPDGTERAHRILKSQRTDVASNVVAVPVLNNSEVFAVPPEHYFVLGDNRDNSADSRTNLGFVPASAIVGKAISHAGFDIE
jgi:signal peptidase I